MHINIISIIIITIARVRDENENNKKSAGRHHCLDFFFVIMQNFKIMRYNKYHMWGRNDNITFE